MRVLGMSLDNSIMDKDSAQAARVIEYGQMLDRLDFIVFSQNDGELNLSDRVRVSAIKKSGGPITLLRLFFCTAKLLENEKYDVLTVQDQYYVALVGYKLARKFNLGFEIQIHGFEKFRGLRKLIAKFVIPRASAIRTVSQRLKSQLIQEFRVDEQKITVAPIYIEKVQSSKFKVQNQAPLVKDLKKESNSKIIFLTVSRLVPVKNTKMQIEAMAEVIKKYPQAELWIVGDGPEKSSLEFKVKSLKLDTSVKFFNRQSDLDSYYSQADAFLLTSNQEGWGMVIVEAASFGLPIIMTDVGCAGEFIKNNESDIVITVGDKNALVEAMLRLAGDTELREGLGKEAKFAVGRLPDKQELLNLYLKSWHKAVENKK